MASLTPAFPPLSWAHQRALLVCPSPQGCKGQDKKGFAGHTGLSGLELPGTGVVAEPGLMTPLPVAVFAGSAVEPSTVNSSPTWKSTGLSRDCGSKTRTLTRPNAASCSSGPWPGPARQGLLSWPLPTRLFSCASAHLCPRSPMAACALTLVSSRSHCV